MIPEKDRGKAILEILLGKGIPVYVDYIFQQAELRGVSRTTLKALRAEMNIQSAPIFKDGKNVGQVWFLTPGRENES
jgi:hypothetical protein